MSVTELRAKGEKWVKVQYPGGLSQWLVHDVAFDDQWITLTLPCGGEVFIYSQSIQHMEVDTLD